MSASAAPFDEVLAQQFSLVQASLLASHRKSLQAMQDGLQRENHALRTQSRGGKDDDDELSPQIPTCAAAPAVPAELPPALPHSTGSAKVGGPPQDCISSLDPAALRVTIAETVHEAVTAAITLQVPALKQNLEGLGTDGKEQGASLQVASGRRSTAVRDTRRESYKAPMTRQECLSRLSSCRNTLRKFDALAAASDREPSEAPDSEPQKPQCQNLNPRMLAAAASSFAKPSALAKHQMVSGVQQEVSVSGMSHVDNVSGHKFSPEGFLTLPADVPSISVNRVSEVRGDAIEEVPVMPALSARSTVVSSIVPQVPPMAVGPGMPMPYMATPRGRMSLAPGMFGVMAAQQSYQLAPLGGSPSAWNTDTVSVDEKEDVAASGCFRFFVWPSLLQSTGSKLVMTGAGSLLEDIEDSSDDEDDEDLYWQEAPPHIRMTRRIMLRPNSPFRLIWNIISYLLVAYEFVFAPIQFMDPDHGSSNSSTTFWSMLTRMFWTFDFFPLNFITGYTLLQGEAEMRLLKVIKKYARGWMCFDIIILLFDWGELLLHGMSGMSFARVGKATRFFRLVRILRLLRVARSRQQLPESLKVVTYWVSSEGALIVVRVTSIMLTLIAVTHLIACGWYSLGNTPQEETIEVRRLGWVQTYSLEDAVLFYRYICALHWSLMATFARSMDIRPQSLEERVFAVVITLFGFVASSCIVSIITSSMTRLQIITADRSTKMNALKQFLLDNRVSTKVAMRVQKSAAWALQHKTRQAPETSIELLSLISEHLKMEMHYDIYKDILTEHPFFKCFAETNQFGMRQICHEAISRISLRKGEVLFTSGDVPETPSMFFCVSGKLHYLQEGQTRAKVINSGQWVAEPVLWTPWVFFGGARAKTECNMLALDVQKFHTVVSRDTGAREYADRFVAGMNNLDHEELTDLMDPGFDIIGICLKIYSECNAMKQMAYKDKHLGDSVVPMTPF